jgi:hypothetical protein
MKVVGCDPGKTGGIAILSDQVTEVMPLNDIYFFCDKMEFLKRSMESFHVFLEKAQSFRGQGVSSTFNYANGFGQLIGALVYAKIPFTLVAPVTWTKRLHEGCKSVDAKKRSLEACRRLFPSVNLIAEGCRTPHTGIVDALLIAEYGRQKLGK